MAKQQRAAKQPEIIDVGDPVLVPVKADGGVIAAFMSNVAAFFERAKGLETRAAATLAEAKTWTVPKNGAEDVTLQERIKAASAEQKEVRELWVITSAASRFHKLLVQHRDRPDNMLEEVKTIGNRLHNAFTDAERRRAQLEEQREREAREAQARLDREKELEQLEAAALKRERESPTLSERESIFVDLIVSGVVASQAAHRAGYKDTTRGVIMLEMPKIKKAIEAKQAAIAARQQAEALRRMPVEVEHVEVKPDIQRAAGAQDRTTWSGEMLDPERFVDAFIEGRYGIPRSIIVAYVAGKGEAALNEQARSMHELLDRWPGVRAKKTTRVV